VSAKRKERDVQKEEGKRRAGKKEMNTKGKERDEHLEDRKEIDKHKEKERDEH
jgi:hypothetical protein